MLLRLALLLSLLASPALTMRVVGGKEPIADLADPALLAVAAHIATEFDKTSASAFSTAVVAVTAGTKQVVAGMTYTLTVDLAETACTKPAAEGAEPCAPLAGAATQSVTANVWVQPWRNFYQVTLSS